MTIVDEIVNKLPDLTKKALILTKNKQWVDDLVQDTVTKAIAKKHQFKEGTDLDSWLFVIMRSIFNTFLYKKMGYKHDKPIFTVETIPPESRSYNPIIELDQYQILGEHLNCLKQFNKDYHNMLLQHVVDEKSIKTISKEQNVPAGTVMSQICRAKKFITSLPCLKQQSDPTAWDINNNKYSNFDGVYFYGTCAEFVKNKTKKNSDLVCGSVQINNIPDGLHNVSVYTKLAKMLVWTDHEEKYGVVFFADDKETFQFARKNKALNV